MSNVGMFRYRQGPAPAPPRRPAEPSARKSTGPDDATKLLVLTRALRRTEHGMVACCEVCGQMAGWRYSIHHRKGRQGRWTDNTAANLLVCCGVGNDDLTTCHGQIHQRASWSRPLGLWLSRHGSVDPAAYAVTIDRGSRVVYLGVDGRYHDNPPSDLRLPGGPEAPTTTSTSTAPDGAT